MKTGSVPPAIMKMSGHLWKPSDATDDPDHVPPVVQKDGTVSGAVNPPVLPETRAERIAMPAAATFQPKKTDIDPDMGEPVRVIDGRIVGAKGFDFEPETEAESLFIESRRAGVRDDQELTQKTEFLI